LIKYLVAFMLALLVIQSLPAEANVQKPVPTTVQVVKPKALPPEPVIPPAIMAKWAKVNICETGGDWHTKGNVYQGGLGILLTNWYAYGGYRLFGPEWSASPAQQVYIAIRIQALSGYAGYVPDQYGCGSW
jgi:Transglycosylase-like domain